MKRDYIKPILSQFEYNLETAISTSTVVTNKTFNDGGIGTDAIADWNWN